MSDNAQRMIALHDHYIQTIDSVVLFLQGKNPTVSLSNAFLTFLDFFWVGLWPGGLLKWLAFSNFAVTVSINATNVEIKGCNAGFTSTLVAFMR
jgi:hypothetical protein